MLLGICIKIQWEIGRTIKRNGEEGGSGVRTGVGNREKKIRRGLGKKIAALR